MKRINIHTHVAKQNEVVIGMRGNFNDHESAQAALAESQAMYPEMVVRVGSVAVWRPEFEGEKPTREEMDALGDALGDAEEQCPMCLVERAEGRAQ